MSYALCLCVAVCVCDFIYVYVFMCGRRKWMFAFLSTPKYEFLILMLLCYYSYALLLLLLLLLYKKNRLYVIVMIFVVCIFYYYYYHSHSFLFNACQRSLSQSTVRCGGIRISNDCIYFWICVYIITLLLFYLWTIKSWHDWLTLIDWLKCENQRTTCCNKNTLCWKTIIETWCCTILPLHRNI